MLHHLTGCHHRLKHHALWIVATLIEKFCLRRSRTESRDTNMFILPLISHRLTEWEHEGFGCEIDGHRRSWLKRCRRCDIEDMTMDTMSYHLLTDSIHERCQSTTVEIYHSELFITIKIMETTVHAISCIIDQDMNFSLSKLGNKIITSILIW